MLFLAGRLAVRNSGGAMPRRCSGGSLPAVLVLTLTAPSLTGQDFSKALSFWTQYRRVFSNVWDAVSENIEGEEVRYNGSGERGRGKWRAWMCLAGCKRRCILRIRWTAVICFLVQQACADPCQSASLHLHMPLVTFPLP